jgi:protein-disulfide isomerase
LSRRPSDEYHRERIGATRTPPPPKRRTGLAAIAAATLIALAGTAALIWFGQRDVQAPTTTPAVATSGNVKGDPQAAVTIEEWADFQCPACRAYATGPAKELEQTLLAEGKAKLVWRSLAFLGEESVYAAEGAKCAQEQGRFWEYHDKLFAVQAGENSGVMAPDNLKRYAAEIGLDTNAFNECLDSGRFRQEVLAEAQEARQKGINSTPTLVVNGRTLEGVPTNETLRALVDEAAGGAR